MYTLPLYTAPRYRSIHYRRANTYLRVNRDVGMAILAKSPNQEVVFHVALAGVLSAPMSI